jgi:hypothetical protein
MKVTWSSLALKVIPFYRISPVKEHRLFVVVENTAIRDGMAVGATPTRPKSAIKH